MRAIPTAGVDLVVTSPPYPMIAMWDEIFSDLDPAIGKALAREQGNLAFDLMHKQLDPVWDEVFRILKTGGIACINIGDATRTVDGNFRLFSNQSRIITYLIRLGFVALPIILWRKQTNAPNKFMGSGMLPPGAYVTLEHEHILILRKGPKREFAGPDEKRIRRESAFFWEERNLWYSDVWMELKGTRQKMRGKELRLRSGAFPFELPYRLINMFSVKGDTIVDPFLGTGTTMFAAMAACRNSIGYETDPSFKDLIGEQIPGAKVSSNAHISERLKNHIDFVEEKAPLKYSNKYYGFPVMARQETELLLNSVISIEAAGDNRFEAIYSSQPQEEFCKARKSGHKGHS
jgi:DNA modification methylase